MRVAGIDSQKPMATRDGAVAFLDGARTGA